MVDFVFLVFRRDSFFKEWWIFYLEEEVSTMVGTGKGRRRECFYSSGENMLSYKLSRCHTRSNQRLKICVAWEEMRHGNSPKLYIDLFFNSLLIYDKFLPKKRYCGLFAILHSWSLEKDPGVYSPSLGHSSRSNKISICSIKTVKSINASLWIVLSSLNYWNPQSISLYVTITKYVYWAHYFQAIIN